MVAIIGILAAVGIVAYTGYVSSTKQKSVENALMQASQQVQQSNQQSAAAIQQSQQGVAQASNSGGGDKPVITGGLPGIGNVNINGVLKTTAYALNSNNNFMRGILR